MKYIKEFKNFNPHPEDKFPLINNIEGDNSDLDREEMEKPLEIVSGFEDDDLEDMSDKEIEDLYSAMEKDIEKRNESHTKIQRIYKRS